MRGYGFWLFWGHKYATGAMHGNAEWFLVEFCLLDHAWLGLGRQQPLFANETVSEPSGKKTLRVVLRSVNGYL